MLNIVYILHPNFGSNDLSEQLLKSILLYQQMLTSGVVRVNLILCSSG